jgi:Putative zinc-finger
MSPGVQHTDIGAYALGALEPDERRRVEAHVAHCPRCRAELPELSRIAAALGTVPPENAAATPTRAPAEPPGRLVALIRERAAADRRRRRRDLLVAAAVGVVVLAGGVAVGSVVAGGPTGDPTAHPADDPAASDVVERSATDPTSGASGSVTMEATSWGTAVGFRLDGVDGPLECELVAVTPAGERVVSGWSVPDAGYGIDGSPAPVTIEGGVADSPDDITRFDVRTSDGRTLLTIPT